MIVLEAIPHETIWGGDRLRDYADKKCGKIGHLYSVYCRKDVSNSILNGSYRGKKLNDMFPEIKHRYQMEKYEFFPLTIALVDAAEHLSIQVHPDDRDSQEDNGTATGKRESWYFINGPTAGYIYNGCKCEDKKMLEEQIREKNIVLIADTLEVMSGDYVYVEPGTLHAITGGSFVYEIEEGSDYTYRFFDYGRKDEIGRERELHLDKAMAVLDIDLKSAVKRYEDSPEIREERYSTRRILSMEQYENVSKTLECITLIAGEMICDGIVLKPGMTVILEPGEKLKYVKIKEAIVATKLP